MISMEKRNETHGNLMLFPKIFLSKILWLSHASRRKLVFFHGFPFKLMLFPWFSYEGIVVFPGFPMKIFSSHQKDAEKAQRTSILSGDVACLHLFSGLL